MSKEIRENIDRVRNWEQFLNENIDNNLGINLVYQQHPELDDIGTPEQYSEYLDTIFPKSKVRDIVYHVSNNKIEKFNKTTFGTYFSYTPISHGGYGTIINIAILNVRNPLISPKTSDSVEVKTQYNKEYRTYENFITDTEGYRSYKYDGSIEQSSVTDNGIQVRVRDPEQIHILGSKEDVEGFKNFIKTTDWDLEELDEV